MTRAADVWLCRNGALCAGLTSQCDACMLCFDVVELVFVHTVDHKNQPYAVLDAGLHIIADADGGELCQAKDQELYAQGASQDATTGLDFLASQTPTAMGNMLANTVLLEFMPSTGTRLLL